MPKNTKMSSVLKELWIFSQAGIPIVEYSKDTRLDKFLMENIYEALRESTTEV